MLESSPTSSASPEEMSQARSVILDDPALAKRWNMAVQTIRTRRMKGDIPRYFKVGRFVRYYLEDVQAYEQDHMVTR